MVLDFQGLLGNVFVKTKSLAGKSSPACAGQPDPKHLARVECWCLASVATKPFTKKKHLTFRHRHVQSNV